MTTSIPHKLEIPPGVLAREVDGETVLLDLDGGRYYGLDPVGTRLWQLLGEGADRARIIEVLEREYEVGRERLGADLERLLAELLEAGLLRAAGEGTDGA